jgi:hypothetical protein
MPELLSTHILPNHPSINDYSSTVDTYIQEELMARQMSGPFGREVVENILRGPFQSSPLIIAVQPQGPGEPDKLRICRHLSKSTKLVPSVNLFIPKHDFPMRFDTVSQVADMVSLLSSSRVLEDTWAHVAFHIQGLSLASSHSTWISCPGTSCCVQGSS